LGQWTLAFVLCWMDTMVGNSWCVSSAIDPVLAPFEGGAFDALDTEAGTAWKVFKNRFKVRRTGLLHELRTAYTGPVPGSYHEGNIKSLLDRLDLHDGAFYVSYEGDSDALGHGVAEAIVDKGWSWGAKDGLFLSAILSAPYTAFLPTTAMLDFLSGQITSDWIGRDAWLVGLGEGRAS